MREPFAGGQVLPPEPSPAVQPEVKPPDPSPLPPEPEFLDPIDEERIVPPTESGFYRVLTPVEDYAGMRYGVLFNEGERVVHESEKVIRYMPGRPPMALRLVDQLVIDFGYRAEPIPVGIPPIPRSQLRAAGFVSPAVASS